MCLRASVRRSSERTPVRPGAELTEVPRAGSRRRRARRRPSASSRRCGSADSRRCGRHRSRSPSAMTCRRCQRSSRIALHPARRARSHCGSTAQQRRPHRPSLVYFHGGGMVMGTNHSFEPLARTLAAPAAPPWWLSSIDWRRSHPAPAQFDDAYAATTWVADNADRLDVDPGRLAVVGDSAGGSLAAAVALAARDLDGPAICCQVLLYPGLDRDMARPVDHRNVRRADALARRHRFMHELADNGSDAPHDPYRVPAYARDLVRPTAGDRRDRRVRPDP